jgi:hypothetical protein
MTRKEFMALCEGVAHLVERKHQDYQGELFTLHDYFPLGDLSYAQMLWVKTMRVMSLAQQKEFTITMQGEAKPQFESRRDSVRDLIAYAVFYLDYLKENDK